MNFTLSSYFSDLHFSIGFIWPAVLLRDLLPTDLVGITESIMPDHLQQFHNSLFQKGTFTTTYDNASSIPVDVWSALESCPCNSNVILPHLLKCRQKEQNGSPTPENQFWIVCSSYNPQPTVEFILAVTTNDISTYPIFITTTCAYSELTPEFLQPRIKKLAQALKDVVHRRRVYSVFSAEPITIAFCEEWSKLTGVRYDRTPYYHANITFCSSKSFVNRSLTIHPDNTFELRPARVDDLFKVAELCKGFSIEGEPFVLTDEAALEEARLLIQNKQVWVHAVRRGNSQDEEIASIAAFTRSSDTVSTITKVYTNPKWRSQGCAERLVRRVCKDLLMSKEFVALYVAHSNPAAAKVYRRVGFVGLDKPVEGVDSWMEIGFDRSQVSLGYW